MDKSFTYCVMPHMGMALQNEADFCCCNVNKASWQDSKRNPMYVYSHPLTNVYKSHTRKMIAASLDHGQQHPSCQVCWDLEAAGKPSHRQNLNQLFDWVDPVADQPRILILKPGNTCNFACRMCNPVTSSSWYKDGHELEKANLTSSSWYAQGQDPEQAAQLSFNEYTRTFESVRNSFNADNTDFWETLKTWMSNLVYIDIYGGEPFLVPPLFDLLQHGIDIGANKNIRLQIHTNASIVNEKYLEILSQYQQLKVGISIDSTDPAQLEYIRHRANYDTLIKNAKKFIEILGHRPNVTLHVSNTITPLNVFYADKTTNELNDLLGLTVGLNLVTTPEYDIRHLPLSVKQYLIQNMSSSLIVDFLKQTIPGCEIEWPKFCQTTDKLDQLRGQSFAQTFPEWWELLQPHWVSTRENLCTSN